MANDTKTPEENVTLSPEDAAAIEKAKAAVEGIAKRHSTGEHKALADTAEVTPEPKKARDITKTSVPIMVVVSFLGAVLGVGVAWGGAKAIAGEQSKTLDDVQKEVRAKADAAVTTAIDARLRVQEQEAAALKAENKAQHEALNEKMTEVKKDTADTKNKVEDLNRKMDLVLSRLPK